MNNELAGYFLYNEEYKEWEETHAGTPNSVPLYANPVNPYQSITDTKIEPTVVSYTHPVKELSRMDVYELAIESGFMLSTQYGEAEHKLMPVSDGDTLVKLANAILRKAQEK